MKNSAAISLSDDAVTLSSPQNLVKDLDRLLLNQTLFLPKQETLGFDEKISWTQQPSGLPQSFTWHSFKLHHSFEKEAVINQIIQSISHLNLPSRLISLIITTADELIMNAFFDAPVKDQTVLFKHTPRNQNIKSEKTVEVNLGINHQEVALHVKDGYGSVNPQAIVKHLKKTFIEDDYQAPSGTGAGIGLSLCVKRNTSLLIKVNPGVSSEFLTFFPIVKNFKNYLEKSQIIALHSQNTTSDK